MVTKDPGGLRRLLALTAGHRGHFYAACVLATVGTGCSILPFLLAALIAGTPDVFSHPQQGIVGGWMAWCLLGTLLVAPLARGLATAVAHDAAFDVLAELRERLVGKLTRLPLDTVTRLQPGQMKRVLNEDVEALELFLSHQLPDVVSSVAIPVLTVCLLVIVDWRMALACLLLGPLIWVANRRTMQGHAGQINLYFKKIGRVNGAAVEFVQGIEDLRHVPGGGLAAQVLRRRVEDFRSFAEGWMVQWSGPWSFYSAVVGAAPLVVVSLVLIIEQNGQVSLDALIFGLFAASGLGAPLAKLPLYGEITSHVLRAEAGIRSLLETPEVDTRDVVRAELPSPSAVAGVQVRDVSLSIEDTPLLSHLSFNIPAGRLTALVGPSGAGKSSVLRLLNRSWDPSAGVITLGDTDLATLSVSQLSRHVALVSQDGFLFDDTVAANIRAGRPDASDAEVKAVADKTLCTSFIETLPQGFMTTIGERGCQLSGGQRQRLTLARALLAGGSLLLLDEVTSFLDSEHEAAVQAAVSSLVGEKTIVIVSHRLDSIQHADHIVFLDKGSVQGQGTHVELLGNCAGYARLWGLQQQNLDWKLTAGDPLK